MFDLARYLAEVSETPFGGILFDLAAKATLLLAAAMVATALLRRSSAAVRHRIWCLTFAGLLLLPGLSALLPEWRLAVLPYSSPLAPREESLPLAPPAVGNQPVLELAAERLHADEPLGLPLAEREDYSTAAHRADAQVEPANAGSAVQAAAWPPISIGAFWSFGALVALLPLLVGLLRTLYLRRSARSISDSRWSELLDDLCHRLTLARRVHLYETDAALMPMTWGVLRPVVMLPRQARDWTDRLRRIVLLHELAHVKRCDVGFQLLGRLACVLYWFHPLAWYALRRLRIERELACDDCVVLAGERASDYAAELLQIARAYRPVYFAAAVAMAQRSNLEHRLLALFDRACSHLPVSPRTARLLLASVLVFVTTIAAVRVAPRTADAYDDEQANATADSANNTPQSTAPRKDETHALRLHGRVVDEKGQAVNQARVRVFHVDSESGTWIHRGRILVETRSDARGEFSVEYATPSAFVAREHFTEPSLIVLADAAAYACDWHELEPGDQELALALSSDDVPLEGRVLDLEGRPIQGVRVNVERVTPAAKDLGEWIEAAKQNPITVDERWMARPINDPERRNAPKVARFPGKKSLWVSPAGFLPATQSDKNGKFKLTGLGRDRLVRLQLEGKNIAKTWLNAVTHEMPPVPYPENDPRFRLPTCFGRRFDFTAERDQPIAGVVRDADSGRPLPRVEVRLAQYADSLLLVEGFLGTVTDDAGRYTLRGAPKPHDAERKHRLRIVPPDDEPYFRTDIPVARQDGLEAVECDIRLKRATWLRGRVTDAVTRKPVAGLVEYYPFLSNKAAADYPNFVPGMHSVEGDRYPTRDDGSFQLPALPGHGLVAFIAQRADRYPEADGADHIGVQETEGTATNVYHLASTELTTAVREVEVPAEGGDFVCDIELKPLDVAQVALVDPDGRPLSGVVTRRGAPIHIAGAPYDDPWSSEPLRLATAEIVGPRDQYRTLVFLHRERKLAAAVSLSPEHDSPRQVVLRACGAISGRVVDADHKPVAHLYIHINAAASASERPTGWAGASFDSRHQIDFVRTDNDGRFRLELVPPEIAYVIGGKLGSATFEKTTPVLQPGQSLELGDLLLRSRDGTAKTSQPAAAGKTQAASTGESSTQPPSVANEAAAGAVNDDAAVTLRGRVLLPDGKPAAGAGLYWVRFKAPPPRKPEDVVFEKRALADDEGRFEFSLLEHDAPLEKTQTPLIAHLPGYGVDWLETAQDQVPQDVVLRLVADHPIRGRVTDTEGRRVAGAKVTVRIIAAPPNGSLDDFLAAWKQRPQNARMNLERQCYAARFLPLLTTVTDLEGRFELSGIGVERVASINITAPGLVSEDLEIVNRDGFDTDGYNKAAQAGMPPQMRMLPRFTRLTGPVIEHVAETELVVRGTVFTGADRKPVVRAIVGSQGRGLNNPISANTDEQGRFELRGLRRSQDSALAVHAPRGSNLLFKSIKLELAPGQTAVDVEVEMRQGVFVEGRVFDKATGHGVRCAVNFVPLPGNENAGESRPAIGQIGNPTDEDGRFRMLVMPGLGVLMAQAQTGRQGFPGGTPASGNRPMPYRQARFSEADSQRVPTGGDDDDRYFTDAYNTPRRLMSHNAVKVIEVLAGGEPATCDLSLDPGKTVTIAIEDEQGRAVADTVVSGVADAGQRVFRAAEPSRTIYGLGADRPRHVWVLQPERHLAGSVVLTGDEPGPVTVRLGAVASIVGRALDPDGEPLADAVVQIGYTRRSAFELSAPTNQNQTPFKTEADGRFRVENVLPGERLSLSFRQGDEFYGGPRITDEKRQLKPGETLELGEFKAKELQ